MSISKKGSRHRCDRRDYSQLPLLRISPEFKEVYNRSLGELKIGEVMPKLKGSFSRKEDGEIISDIDNNSKMVFTPNVPGEIFAMLNNLEVNPESKFHFLYLGCGWYNGYHIPWTIDTNGGCDFDLQQADEWLENLNSRRMISPRLYEKIHLILNADEIRIRDLIKIRGLIKDTAEIKWNKEWIDQGYVEREGPDGEVVRYDLLDMMRKNNAILEFAFHYRGPYYVSVTTSVYEKSISAFKTMWDYYSGDYYKMLKGIKWDIYPDRLTKDFKSAMESCAPYVSVSYQLQLLKDMRKFTDLNVTSMWRDVIRPSLHILSGKEIPDDPPSDNKLDKYDSWLKIWINHTTEECYPSKQYTRYIQKNKVNRRYEIEKSLIRMRSASKGVTREELVRRRDSGNDCPFFEMHIEDLDVLADLAKRSRIPLDDLVRCYDDESSRLGINIRDLIKDTIVPSGIHLQIPQGKTILIFHGPPDERKEAGRLRYTEDNLKLAQRIVMTFGHPRSTLGTYSSSEVISPKRISKHRTFMFGGDVEQAKDTLITLLSETSIEDLALHNMRIREANRRLHKEFHKEFGDDESKELVSINEDIANKVSAIMAFKKVLNQSAQERFDESKAAVIAAYLSPTRDHQQSSEALNQANQKIIDLIVNDIKQKLCSEHLVESSEAPKLDDKYFKDALSKLFIRYYDPDEMKEALYDLNERMMKNYVSGVIIMESGIGSESEKCLRFWLAFILAYKKVISKDSDSSDSDEVSGRDQDLVDALSNTQTTLHTLNELQYRILRHEQTKAQVRLHKEIREDEALSKQRDALMRKQKELLKLYNSNPNPDPEVTRLLEELLDKPYIPGPTDMDLINRTVNYSDCMGPIADNLTSQLDDAEQLKNILQGGIKISVKLSIPPARACKNVSFYYFPGEDTPLSVAKELLAVTDPLSRPESIQEYLMEVRQPGGQRGILSVIDKAVREKLS